MAHAALRQMKIHEIASPGNALLKVFRRALAEGTTRQGWLAVEGPFLLEEALGAASGTKVHSVLVTRSGVKKFAGLLNRVPQEAELAEVPDRLFGRIAETPAPQGIAALVELPPYDLEKVLSRGDTLLLVACSIQDPGNLGTMMRSASAFGASALLTLVETVSPWNPKAVRSSAGAVFHLPVFSGLKADEIFGRLRSARVRVVATARRGPATVAQADLRGSLAILIGREATGLPREYLREAQQLLSIPIRAGMDSVNAATAASIFLYEAARQRGFKY